MNNSSIFHLSYHCRNDNDKLVFSKPPPSEPAISQADRTSARSVRPVRCLEPERQNSTR